MANNLFPEGYENEIVTAEDLNSQQPTGYKNGIAFDSLNGDFLRDGMNKMLDSDGIDSWKSWCINCLQTERYKHLAYGPKFGIDVEKAMKASSWEEAENILNREITEAILADPYKRSRYVKDISYEWTAPDSVVAYVTICGVDDATIDITAYITRGEG